MLSTRNGLPAQFTNPTYTTHPEFPYLRTFDCVKSWKGHPVVELSKLKLEIKSIDYLELPQENIDQTFPQLRFQQDCFRLWYQMSGTGILQNATRNNFGAACPGLLGVIERGERYSYLHQKGKFECFQILFSMLPSNNAKCYWNSGIEGKIVIKGNERLHFENLIFDLLLVITQKKEILGIATISKILEIIVVLFNKGILIVEESQFPKNKAKSLVIKAKTFMDLHYYSMHHQQKLESECGVDINYLNIIFKKETNRTLYQYITGIRMEHAKHLLETSSMPISEIANKTGYPNSNSFTRAFKRLLEKTPHNYRKFFHNSIYRVPPQKKVTI